MHMQHLVKQILSYSNAEKKLSPVGQALLNAARGK